VDESASQAARDALDEFAVEATELVRVSIAENIVFRVSDCAGGTYVLRLHRPGYHSYKALASEQLWATALRSDGIAAPRAHATAQGAYFARVQIEGQYRYASLLEWVAGDTLLDVMRSGSGPGMLAHSFGQLGELMARLHQQACAWTPPPEFERHSFDEDGFAGPAPFWGRFWECSLVSRQQRTALARLRPRIRRALSTLSKDRDSFSLIHADLHPGNVVVGPEGLHIIDFDDAGFGWHAYDIAVALMSYRDSPNLEQLLSALAAGYRRCRPLAPETLEQVPLFLPVRGLAWLGWMDARQDLEFIRNLPDIVCYLEESAEAVLARYDR